MPHRQPLDYLPLWGLFVATLGVVLLSLEGGFRMGRWGRRRRSEQVIDAPIGAMVGATLGLLAFMLAFTFGIAASRFDVRRQLFLDEVNGIGTAYLRAELLPAPHRAEVRNLLREYVDARLEGAQPGKVDEAIRRSEALHGQLWSHAVAVGEKHPGSIVAGLFIESLNDVIDLHTKRLTAGLRSRIPRILWYMLLGITVISMFAAGYHAGLTGANRSLVALGLALTFSAVIYLIADFDRPQEGSLRVSQQAMVELRSSMDAPTGR